jgi:hypothetical protein
MSVVGELVAELVASVLGEAAWSSTSRRMRRVVKFLLLAIVWSFIAFFFFVSLYAVLLQGELLGLLVAIPAGLLAWVMVRERLKVRAERLHPTRRVRPSDTWHGPVDSWDQLEDRGR